jgi:hypothetical protein
MKNHQPKPSVTNYLRGVLMLGLWALGALAFAGPVAGTVVQLSGPLLVKKASGSTKILSLKSEVENGDTLITEKNTYAMVKMIDNSTMTLSPASSVTIENFSFDDGKPENDDAKFKLVKGGLRSVTGLLGKRSKEKYELKTPAATIGIRGTTFIASYVAPDPETALASAQAFLNASTASLPVPASDAGIMAPVMLAQAGPPRPSGPALPPGLYVSVIDGAINLSNKGGALNFSAGQFGYTPNVTQPPVIVPKNPGILFTPPPSFNASAPTGPSGGSSGKSSSVDCEVR